MKADWVVIGLLVVYVVAAVLYIREGNWSKTLYFAGSAVLTIGILLQ